MGLKRDMDVEERLAELERRHADLLSAFQEYTANTCALADRVTAIEKWMHDWNQTQAGHQEWLVRLAERVAKLEALIGLAEEAVAGAERTKQMPVKQWAEQLAHDLCTFDENSPEARIDFSERALTKEAANFGLHTPLRWMKTPPTKPGPYWIRLGRPGGLQRRTIVRVRRDKLDGGLFVRWAGKKVHVEFLDAEWSSAPIAMPEEP